MSGLLAQARIPLEQFQPDVAWSSFAPELAMTATVLGLLLLATLRNSRLVVGVLLAVIGVGVGAWLVASPPQEAVELSTFASALPGAVAILLGASTVAMVIATERRPALLYAWVAWMGTFAALVLTFWQRLALLPAADAASATVMEGSVAVDGIAFFTRLTVYVTTLFVIPMGWGYARERGIARPEYEPLLLLSATGMALLGAAADLITLFVALEILSIALYVLAGFARRDRRSQEASIKYFVLGAVASALLLYGMALLYVGTGTLALSAIAETLRSPATDLPVPALGLALITVGLGFKVALAPFQLWTVDVYQGSPTNVTAFMAAATKAAGFAAVLRIYFVAFGPLTDLWVPLLAGLAAITMLYGAFVAITQSDVKRVLAYSSIAHAGYAVVGVVAASPDGLAATLWYLLTYAVSTMLAFAAVIALERRRRGEVALVDLRGLGRTSPMVAGLLMLALLSLAGIPGTAGFNGKLEVFKAGMGSDLAWLVVVGLVSSVVAAFFYLRLMGMMFLEDPEPGPDGVVVPLPLSTSVRGTLVLAGVLVVVLGVAPQALIQTAQDLSAVLGG